ESLTWRSHPRLWKRGNHQASSQKSRGAKRIEAILDAIQEGRSQSPITDYRLPITDHPSRLNRAIESLRKLAAVRIQELKGRVPGENGDPIHKIRRGLDPGR